MFLTIGLTRFFQQPTETNFLPNCVCIFSGSCMSFTTTSWRRRMFLEFVRSLRCFWNVCGEFNTCEFTPMEMDNSLSVNG